MSCFAKKEWFSETPSVENVNLEEIPITGNSGGGGGDKIHSNVKLLILGEGVNDHQLSSLREPPLEWPWCLYRWEVAQLIQCPVSSQQNPVPPRIAVIVEVFLSALEGSTVFWENR